ncbi:LPS export ABC transporter periplasmic protein LptC [Teredinibacter waterburyi]|uniref:LPS export ABC transporter periplasmic protein LptC n=1 Tax=Teredinibacter waterburyi TaxID=1500538 RepID=UPI00165F4C11|nr:LPS export ABC transporter periplasmic protein LptC [Teredinibacter waterburyi]
MPNKNITTLALILVAICGIVVLWDSSEKILPAGNPSRTDAPLHPYALADHASTRHFNEAGELEYEFTARRLEHYLIEPQAGAASDNSEVGQEYTLIKDPQFTLYQNNQPWHIEAREGRINQNQEQIELWDNVRIWQDRLPLPQASLPANPAALKPHRSEFSTETLTIYPAQKIAETEEPVTIRTTSGTIEAVGLHADFNARKIRLLSKVRAVHEFAVPSLQSLQ